MPEQQNIEYKQSWHDDYLKWVCGFANACFFAGYIDTWGRGTLKIINSCKEAGLPEPEIKEMDGGIEVTIFLHSNKVIISGQDSGQAGGQVDSLTERQRAVFNIILSNPKISRKQLSEKLGINESAIQKHIDALKKKNFIERDSKTTGQWIIKIKL